MNDPLISVLMAVYNGLPYLEGAVYSVLEQRVAGGLELILVDDGSSDGSGELLDEIATQHPGVRLLRQENQGLTVSLNRAAGESRGRYLARMDADDLSLPGRLMAQAALLDADSKAGACGCWYGRMDELGAVFGEVCLADDGEVLKQRLLAGLGPFAHGSALIRREALEAVGGYNEGFRYAQDFELWLRLLAAGWGLRLAPEVLYLLRTLPGQVDDTSAKARFQAAVRDEALAAFREGRPARAPQPPASETAAARPCRDELEQRYHLSLGRLAALDGRAAVAWRHFAAAGKAPLGAVMIPGLRLAAPFLRRWWPGLREQG